MEPVVWFADLQRTDTGIAGGKGANLGELVSGGFPVPSGFVVTADAYLASMEAAHIRDELRGDPTDSAGPSCTPRLVPALGGQWSLSRPRPASHCMTRWDFGP